MLAVLVDTAADPQAHEDEERDEAEERADGGGEDDVIGHDGG